MNLVHLVALLAVVQFLGFSFLVGRARDKYGIPAPAITGHPEFERVFRVQMNTLEQLVCFLPAVLIAGAYWPQPYIAAIGFVYLVGRLIYRASYLRDPSKRTIGFLLTVIPTFSLVAAGLSGALFRAAV